ncbi:MAG: transcriptional regulator [Pelagibacterales bacterium MED-G42]|nr:MAG: transcriptional regulator [Pelagibacterales bacterium MED-G42]|tara:strand:- start:233 stop:793 length:561 start_codon:yes stop_codon:yes gene_type:complete
MKNHQLVIYDFKILFHILDEIKEYLNFEIINLSKVNYENLINEYPNSIIISKREIKDIKSVVVIKDFPLKIKKIIEIINTNFLKKQFSLQSNKTIGLYSLDLNSKKISKDNIFLELTEKEIKLIDFLKSSKHPISINELQKKVWGYVSSLETHTVETHVYRLRKKFSKTFSDADFIISNKKGYYIK